MDHPALVKAVDWLESIQQPSGAWGETCRSYDDPALKGTGEPTPSQTAWATLGLDRRRPRPRRGRPPRHRLPDPEPSCPTAPGMKPQFTGTASPACSICAIIFTGSISRSWRSRATRRPSSANARPIDPGPGLPDPGSACIAGLREVGLSPAF